jgi:hypothetical protein
MNCYRFVADTFVPLQPAQRLYRTFYWDADNLPGQAVYRSFVGAAPIVSKCCGNRDRPKASQYYHECQTHHPRCRARQGSRRGCLDRAGRRSSQESYTFSKYTGVTCFSSCISPETELGVGPPSLGGEKRRRARCRKCQQRCKLKGFLEAFKEAVFRVQESEHHQDE